MLDVSFRIPALALRRFVRFYVQRRVRIEGAPIVHPVPARAAPMIEFGFADRVDVRSADRGELFQSPPAVLVGPQTRRRVDMHLHGSLDSFVIMFQPDGLHRLFAVPAREMTDAHFEVQAVLGSAVAQLGQRLGECRSFHERVSLVDAHLLRQAARAGSFDGISAAAHEVLRAGGRVHIASLADAAGMGTRQFERKFAEKVGMRPKLFARVARFEAALDYKARFAAKLWSDVAQQFGYYDQMHMIHDFADFAGSTPTEMLTQLEANFVQQIRTLRSGAGADDGHPRLML